MTPEIGHFILWLALGLSVALGVVPLWGAQCGRTAWMTLARPGAWAVFALVVLSYIALTIAFVRDDFLKRLGEIQRDTIKSGAIHLNELKVKGIVREDFDTHGSLAWFDSLFFGRIVVEITDDDELLTRWDTVAREVVYVSLFGADGFALPQRTK